MPVADPKTWVEISRSALRHNAAVLRRVIGREAKLLAVVKSNAYGHGLEIVAPAIRGQVDWFGVDSLAEAEALKRLRLGRPILILGYVPLRRLARAVRRGFSLTVYNLETLRQLRKVATKSRPAKIHLKIETGTSRQGILMGDLPQFAKFIRDSRHLQLEGVSTHYANIEDTTNPTYAMRQLKRYHEAVSRLAALGLEPKLRHTAASAAALLFPVTRLDLVRVGLALYGLWPSPAVKRLLTAAGPAYALRPALTWKTVVAQVKRLPKRTPVSYGLTERLKRNSTVAILPVGYWDGYDRRFSSQGQVLIRGRRAKILGRVCMNMGVADATGIPGVKPETEVVLLGRQGRGEVSAEELANLGRTINYEVVTRINPLIARRATA